MASISSLGGRGEPPLDFNLRSLVIFSVDVVGPRAAGHPDSQYETFEQIDTTGPTTPLTTACCQIEACNKLTAIRWHREKIALSNPGIEHAIGRPAEIGLNARKLAGCAAVNSGDNCRRSIALSPYPGFNVVILRRWETTATESERGRDRADKQRLPIRMRPGNRPLVQRS
jgi:hypothetical protein